MSDEAARPVVALEVRMGDLLVRWAPASDQDGLPVEIRDESREQVVTYTDLAGVTELAVALTRFAEHHYPGPKSAGTYADPEGPPV